MGKRKEDAASTAKRKAQSTQTIPPTQRPAGSGRDRVLRITPAPRRRGAPAGAAPVGVQAIEPRHARMRTGMREHLAELRGAVADGWEIVQPIFARPLWSAPDDSTTAFSFVLRREHATRLLTIPEGRSVERFIRDHDLTIDYPH